MTRPRADEFDADGVGDERLNRWRNNRRREQRNPCLAGPATDEADADRLLFLLNARNPNDLWPSQLVDGRPRPCLGQFGAWSREDLEGGGRLEEPAGASRPCADENRTSGVERGARDDGRREQQRPCFGPTSSDQPNPDRLLLLFNRRDANNGWREQAVLGFARAAAYQPDGDRLLSLLNGRNSDDLGRAEIPQRRPGPCSDESERRPGEYLENGRRAELLGGAARTCLGEFN